jgi:hypothetical protein
MSWIKDLFTSSVGTLVKELGDAIDKNVTNDEERLALSNALAEIQAKTLLASKELDLKYESEITARHTSDMTSDDVWSKRIRPLSLAFLLAVVSILAVTDGNLEWGQYTFEIQQSYVDLFRALLMTAFAFYFGGRSLEKITKMKTTQKE